MKGIRATVFGAALSAFGVAASAAPCKLEQMEIRVRVEGLRPIATLTINGTPAPLLLDSGAFFSMLSPATAAQLKLPLRRAPSGLRVEGYAGRVEVQRTRVDKLGLVDAQLADVDFLVGGNELGSGIMGILGRNILSAADAEYDLAHGVVRLSFPKGDCAKTSFAHWAGDAPVVVLPIDGNHDDTSIRIEVAVNGKRMSALMDTGAAFTVLPLSLAHRAGIEERDLVRVGRANGAGQGAVNIWSGTVSTFELGGEKIANNRLMFSDAGADDGLLIGLDYFLSHRIYVSRLQRQVYITWNGGPIFAQGKEAAAGYDTRYAALPPEVDKDDADALARRGAAAFAAGNLPRALEDLNRACELAPTVATHFYDRARVHVAMHESRRALEDLDEALRLDPAFVQARFARAVLRESQDDWPPAQEDLARLDATLPPSASERAGMAESYARMGKTAEAMRQSALWIDSHPKDVRLADVLSFRCWTRARRNIELELALADCRLAIAKDEGDAVHHGNLGWTYLRLDDTPGAMRAFDASLALKPTALSLFGRGLTRLRHNDPAAAARDFQEARKLDRLVDAQVRTAGFEFAQAVEPPRP